MARAFPRLLAALLLALGLSACVAPYHHGHRGWGNHGYAQYQPAYRGGYAHQRGWR